MTMKGWMVMGAVLLAGCGMSPEQFNEESADLYCKTAVDCEDELGISFDSEQDCKAFLKGFGSVAVESCDYDGKLASDCISDLKKADCAALAEGPKSCDKVFSGPDCESSSTSE